ncbi:AhpC/TSA antioxidant enzyme-domain-containing protein [Dactylonectria estremocensis]|uniref:AhpC/TSA antioxidant enzyme-domain-containing protein n=1 Tax=Dactylonectria estremocensis TaxID=1079267 RepID=A0A9P9EZ93_9HYPO|nr:AhpC/TSA antioxidant enzyme-domain-containing protein [Dactylonectria estremocensis]
MGDPSLEDPAPRPDASSPNTESTDPPPQLPSRPPPPYVFNAADDVNHDRHRSDSEDNNSSGSGAGQRNRDTSPTGRPGGPPRPSTFSIPRKAVGTSSRTPSLTIDINTSQPEDFEGELATNNELPTRDTLRKIGNYNLLDRDGKTHPFKSLYTGSNVARRVLVIFVRHFFCGNCQEFLRSLSEAITPDSLLRLPVSTFIAVVGCGDPRLIDMYVTETNCPFPVYTDPTRSLFQALDMVNTLALGTKPAYMRKSMTRSIMDSVVQGIKQIPNGNALKSGDQRQVGGEFLFEPRDINSPVTTPRAEKTQPVGAFEEPSDKWAGGGKGADHREDEEKTVTWCHRMKTTRDHAEISELIEVLGLPAARAPAVQPRRQGSGGGPSTMTSPMRKGRGHSMAEQIRKLSAEQSRSPQA